MATANAHDPIPSRKRGEQVSVHGVSLEQALKGLLRCQATRGALGQACAQAETPARKT